MVKKVEAMQVRCGVENVYRRRNEGVFHAIRALFQTTEEAVSGEGSLPSTPVAFLDTGFDDLRVLLELQRAVTPME